MKKYIYTLLSLAVFSMMSCDDILDRPQMTKANDEKFWRNETDFRLYAKHS